MYWELTQMLKLEKVIKSYFNCIADIQKLK
jgi:hypothetical protein